MKTGFVQKLSPDLGHQAIIKAFQKAGWTLVHGGSHDKLIKVGFPNLTIPRHNPVDARLLKSQIKQAGMTVEQFKRYL
jgi:predicted RNA binding protein YcfA (HicA-like mRNA interferase family)